MRRGTEKGIEKLGTVLLLPCLHNPGCSLLTHFPFSRSNHSVSRIERNLERNKGSVIYFTASRRNLNEDSSLLSTVEKVVGQLNQMPAAVTADRTRALEKSSLSAQQLIELGAVYVNGIRKIDQTYCLKVGDCLRIYSRPTRFLNNSFCLWNSNEESLLYQWKGLVQYEDEDFIVVNKPAGIPSHPTIDNIKENILYQMAKALDLKEIYVTHRLDLPTSGLIVLAKSKQFQVEFNKMLEMGKVKKIYKAIITGNNNIYNNRTKQNIEPLSCTIRLGELRHWMKPYRNAKGQMISSPPYVLSNFETSGWLLCRSIVHSKNSIILLLNKNSGKLEKTRAITQQNNSAFPINESKYSVITAFEIDIELLTGRAHQIRAQLAHEDRHKAIQF